MGLAEVSKDKEVSEREVAREDSLGTGQGFVKGGCKTGCENERCKCKVNKDLCNCRCNNSLSCKNK